MSGAPVGVQLVFRYGTTYYVVPPYRCPTCGREVTGEFVGHYLSLSAATASLHRGQNSPCFSCTLDAAHVKARAS
jgi:hypothetical protein